MSTTPHPVAPEEITAHLDGELSPARAQSVAAHLETCAECSELSTSFGNTSRLMSNWQVGPVPASLNQRFATAEKHPQDRPVLGSIAKRLRASAFLWAAGLATCVLLLMAISIPNLLRSRMAANEASSVGSLRTISTAISTYEQTYGHYPRSLKNLGPSRNGQRSEDGAGLIDPVLAQGEKSGYRYSYQPNSGRYTIDASPVQAGTTGQRHFSTDQTGVLSADNVPLDGDLIAAPPAVPSATTNSSREFTKLQQFARIQRPQSAETETGPMIARTVLLAILVKDFDTSRKSIDSILVSHNGYSANLSVSTPQGAARSLQASLRIPAPQLPAALGELKSLGRVENESQNGEEVTQQHADLVARLKNSRETEQRLQTILTQRTGKISDVLAVEQEIARARGEIEQMEAEQKNLEHRVDFATIDLKLSEEYKAKLDSPAPAISTLIHNAAVNGYRNVADTLLSIVLFFAEYGPVLAFWLLLFSIPTWLVWRRWRHATAAI
jgi:hypothetical protein